MAQDYNNIDLFVPSPRFTNTREPLTMSSPSERLCSQVSAASARLPATSATVPGGLGAFWLLPGLANLLTMISGSVNRGRLFYGSNPAEVRRLQQQQAVRI